MKQATLILLSDIHLREDQPICRTDDYWKAQEKAISFIETLQHDQGCPILISGDIFDRWKTSPKLLSWAIDHLPDKAPQDSIIVISGQHDLPNHSIELLEKSGLRTLEAANTLLILREQEPYRLYVKGFKIDVYGFPFGSKLKPLKQKNSADRSIAMLHYFTYQGRSWPGCQSLNARSLLKKMEGYDLVLVGDNHQSFVVEDDGRLLVNPGSMMRMKADQIDHEPRCYLYYADNNTVEPVYFPIENDVISRIHIDVEKEKDERIEAFVTSVKNQGEIGLNFKENLEKYFVDNEEHQEVKDIIWRSFEG